MKVELRKMEKKVSKNIFQVNEYFTFSENYKECKKTYRYQPCNNEKRRNYLVSEPNYHTTNFFRKFISCRN